jgi:hypothetical protein
VRHRHRQSVRSLLRTIVNYGGAGFCPGCSLAGVQDQRAGKEAAEIECCRARGDAAAAEVLEELWGQEGVGLLDAGLPLAACAAGGISPRATKRHKK